MINFFSKYKSIFYLSNLILLVLYLFPGSLLGCFLYNDCQLQPQITKDFLVSTNHLYAFGLLSIIGLFTYKNSNKIFKFIFNCTFNNFRNITYIYSCKKFELSDLFGNLLGVSIVLTVNFFYRKYENYKN